MAQVSKPSSRSAKVSTSRSEPVGTKKGESKSDNSNKKSNDANNNKGKKKLSFEAALDEEELNSDEMYLESSLALNSEIIGSDRLLLCLDVESPVARRQRSLDDESLMELLSIDVNNLANPSSSTSFVHSPGRKYSVAVHATPSTTSTTSGVSEITTDTTKELRNVAKEHKIQPTVAPVISLPAAQQSTAESIIVPPTENTTTKVDPVPETTSNQLNQPVVEISSHEQPHTETIITMTSMKGKLNNKKKNTPKHVQYHTGKTAVTRDAHSPLEIKTNFTGTTESSGSGSPTPKKGAALLVGSKRKSIIPGEFQKLAKFMPKFKLDREMRKTIVETMKNLNYWNEEELEGFIEEEIMYELFSSDGTDGNKAISSGSSSAKVAFSPTPKAGSSSPQTKILDRLSQPVHARAKVTMIKPAQIFDPNTHVDLIEEEKQLERETLREKVIQKALDFLIQSMEKRKNKEQFQLFSSVSQTITQRNMQIKRLSYNLVEKAIKINRKDRIKKLEKRKYKEKLWYAYKIKVSYYLYQCWRRSRIRKYCDALWKFGKQVRLLKLNEENKETLEYRKRVAQRRIHEDAQMKVYFQQLKLKQEDYITTSVMNGLLPSNQPIEFVSSWERTKANGIDIYEERYPGSMTTSYDHVLFSKEDSICRPDLAPLSTQINAMISKELYAAEIAFYMKQTHRVGTATGGMMEDTATGNTSPGRHSSSPGKMMMMHTSSLCSPSSTSKRAVFMPSTPNTTTGGGGRKTILRPQTTNSMIPATPAATTVVRSESPMKEDNVRKPNPPSTPKPSKPSTAASSSGSNARGKGGKDVEVMVEEKTFYQPSSSYLLYAKPFQRKPIDTYEPPPPSSAATTTISTATPPRQIYSDFVIPRRPPAQAATSALSVPSPRRYGVGPETNYNPSSDLFPLPTLSAMNQYYKDHFDEFANIATFPTVEEVKNSTKYKSPAYKALEKIMGYSEEEIKRKSILTSLPNDTTQQKQQEQSAARRQITEVSLSADQIVQEKLKERVRRKASVFYL